MGTSMRYLWWSSFGAFAGGWMSALLAWYAVLAPAQHVSVFPFNSEVVALAHHAHALVLSGILMGAASGVCSVRFLARRPVRRWNPTALTLAVLLVAISLPWLNIFSGSVAGLQIDSHGAMIVTMNVVRSGHKLLVPVGQTAWACGSRGARAYGSYRDHSVVVTLCCRCLLFPWQ